MAAEKVIICHSRCWPCMYGSHHNPPQWHTWADEEDVAHCAKAGRPDPRESRCACECADAPKPAPENGDTQ